MLGFSSGFDCYKLTLLWTCKSAEDVVVVVVVVVDNDDDDADEPLGSPTSVCFDFVEYVCSRSEQGKR